MTTHGLNADVVLSLLGVRHEWLDQKPPEHTVDSLHPLGLARTLCDPVPRLLPGLVEGEKTALASSLDQLIRLRDELGVLLQQPWILDLGLVEDGLDFSIFGEVYRGESRRGIVGCGRRQRSGLDDWSASEVVVEDGLAVGLEDGFGRHRVSW